jgi:hypothetical protein
VHQRQPVAVGQAQIDKADIGGGAGQRGLEIGGAAIGGGAKTGLGQGVGQKRADLRLVVKDGDKGLRHAATSCAKRA